MKSRTRIILVVFLGAFLFAVIDGRAQQTPGLDTKAIDQTLIPGQMQGDVYRVGLPRTDLKVTVHGIAIKPGLALGSWAAFRRAGNQTVIHGDLVLLESEINPVISKLQDGGLQITALHNHLIDETPHLMYLHYWGQGSEAALAKALRAALETTKTPLMVRDLCVHFKVNTVSGSKAVEGFLADTNIQHVFEQVERDLPSSS